MPATNGSRISLRSHSSSTTTTMVASQNTNCRSKLIGPSKPEPTARPRRCSSRFRRVHVAHPLREIEGDREQGQDRDQPDQRLDRKIRIDAESERPEHHHRKYDLRHRVEF